jgi:hypothetical protein
MPWEVLETKTARRIKVDYAIRVSRTKSKSRPTDKLNFTISQSVLFVMRWELGDRVMLMQDTTNKMIALAKGQTANALKLLPANHAGKKSQLGLEGPARITFNVGDKFDQATDDNNVRFLLSKELLLNQAEGWIGFDYASENAGSSPLWKAW